MPTQKYHYSTKTRKIELCSAEKKTCQYKTHYEITPQKVNLQLPEGLTKPPIIVKPSIYNEPRLFTNFSTPDPRKAILKILGQPETHKLSNELEQLIIENQWESTNNWIKNSNRTLTPPKNLYPTLQTWFWSQPNANDKQGILEYVRSKGTTTTNLTPLEAVQKQHIEENLLLLQLSGTSFLNKILQTTRVQKTNIELAKISAGKTRIQEIEARAPHNHKNEPGIAGILLKTDTKLLLLDGYHRMKHLQQHNIENAPYIVLS